MPETTDTLRTCNRCLWHKRKSHGYGYCWSQHWETWQSPVCVDPDFACGAFEAKVIRVERQPPC
jgi:hypothetical protein